MSSTYTTNGAERLRHLLKMQNIPAFESEKVVGKGMKRELEMKVCAESRPSDTPILIAATSIDFEL